MILKHKIRGQGYIYIFIYLLFNLFICIYNYSYTSVYCIYVKYLHCQAIICIFWMELGCCLSILSAKNTRHCHSRRIIIIMTIIITVTTVVATKPIQLINIIRTITIRIIIIAVIVIVIVITITITIITTTTITITIIIISVFSCYISQWFSIVFNMVSNEI